MTTIQGQSEGGSDRVMDLRVEGERAFLWIHPPDGDDESGLSIYVDARELAAELVGEAIKARRGQLGGEAQDV